MSTQYMSALDQDPLPLADAGHVLTPSLPNSLPLLDVLRRLETDEQSSQSQGAYTDSYSIWLSGQGQTVFKLGGDRIPIAEPAYIEQKIFVRDTATGRFRASTIVKYGIPTIQAQQLKERILTTALTAAKRAGHPGLLVEEKRKFPTAGWASMKRRKGN